MGRAMCTERGKISDAGVAFSIAVGQGGGVKVVRYEDIAAVLAVPIPADIAGAHVNTNRGRVMVLDGQGPAYRRGISEGRTEGGGILDAAAGIRREHDIRRGQSRC